MDVAQLARAAGVTEADVRDWLRCPDRDAVVVRLWNHRRLLVTHYEFARAAR